MMNDHQVTQGPRDPINQALQSDDPMQPPCCGKNNARIRTDHYPPPPTTAGAIRLRPSRRARRRRCP